MKTQYQQKIYDDWMEELNARANAEYDDYCEQMEEWQYEDELEYDDIRDYESDLDEEDD